MVDYLTAGETVVSNMILDNFSKLGMTHQELILYLKLRQYECKGNDFPDLMMISKEIGVSSEEIFSMLEGLLSKKIVKLTTHTNEQGQTGDRYDLTMIYERLDQLNKAKHVEESRQSEQIKIQELYQTFEKEFGRPLSPFELETISIWLTEDNYQPELVILALREAVLNQVYSLKYIDRILLNWERKNIKTKEQVAQDQQKRKKSLSEKEVASAQAKHEEELPTVPLFNWAEDK
ncbi:DnaD domain-containing protein [Vagococcus proximus]|nr:DnaD domain protein [Vagococcus proximus]